MKPYKSIFSESRFKSAVDSVDEAKQIVDISNLKWSKNYEKMSYYDAEENTPEGWRLPTIQELYTAYVQGVKGFKKVTYWSLTRHNENVKPFSFSFNNTEYPFSWFKDSTKNSVRYVKDKD